MLQKITRRQNGPRGGNYAIIASKYNVLYVDAMLRAAKAEIPAAPLRRRPEPPLGNRRWPPGRLTSLAKLGFSFSKSSILDNADTKT